MFGISGFELLIIVAFVLLIFGPEKLPELARLAGKASRMFKSAQADMERIISAEMTAAESRESGKDEPAISAPATEGAPSSTATIEPSVTWVATADDDDEEDEE